MSLCNLKIPLFYFLWVPLISTVAVRTILYGGSQCESQFEHPGWENGKRSKTATEDKLESEDFSLPTPFRLGGEKTHFISSLPPWQNTFAKDYLNTKAWRVKYVVLSYHFWTDSGVWKEFRNLLNLPFGNIMRESVCLAFRNAGGFRAIQESARISRNEIARICSSPRYLRWFPD